MSSVAGADSGARVMREHYEKGSALYDLGKYKEAVVEYEEAYKAKPDPVLLFNLGQAYRLGNDPVGALRSYRSYLRRMPNAPNRVEVDGYIDALQRQLDEEKHRANEPVKPPLPPAPPPTAAPPTVAPATAAPQTSTPATSTTSTPATSTTSTPATSTTLPGGVEPAAASSAPAADVAPKPRSRAWIAGVVVGAVVLVGVAVGVTLAYTLPKDVATPGDAYNVKFMVRY